MLRLGLGTILTAVAERTVRPEIPDLFLVDEAATLGYLDELLTAASLLRGYGLRTWTFWQSQISNQTGADATNIQGFWNDLWASTDRGHLRIAGIGNHR